MGPRRHLCAHLGNLKKNNKSVIDLNILLKLVEQCVTLVGQCHSRGSYFRGQGVLTPLLKDKRQVKSLLKEGAHFLEKEKKVLFLERFQKKVNETIKLKKEIKGLLKEYTKSTPTKRPYYYGSCQPPRQGPQPSLSERGDQPYKNQGFVSWEGQRKFYYRGGIGKIESQLPCDTSIHHKSETKSIRPFKLNQLPKSLPICKNTFQGDQRNFSFGRKAKIFYEKLGKSQRLFYRPEADLGLLHHPRLNALR